MQSSAEKCPGNSPCGNLYHVSFKLCNLSFQGIFSPARCSAISSLRCYRCGIGCLPSKKDARQNLEKDFRCIYPLVRCKDGVRIMNLAVIISSFLSGLLGAMGFGGGAVLIIYLTSFLGVEQKEAQGINLLFFAVTGFLSVIINSKNRLTDKKALLRLLPVALVGLIVGYMLLPLIETELLRKLFGGALLLLGLKELFSKKVK